MPSIDMSRVLLVLIVIVAIFIIYYLWNRNEHYTTQKRVQIIKPPITLRRMQTDPIHAYDRNAIIDPLF